MQQLVPAFIVAVFAFGAAMFWVLSCIERRVLPLGFGRNPTRVSDEDARFVHTALQRLTPLLPPSNGAVILFGTAAMAYQGVLRGWDWPSLVPLGFYWLIVGYLITFGGIARQVREIRSTSSDGNIDDVRHNVAQLVASHHAGLAANLGVVLIEFAIIAAA